MTEIKDITDYFTKVYDQAKFRALYAIAKDDAKKSLEPAGDDILFIARILRKYRVNDMDYHIGVPLEIMAGSSVADDELARYKSASEGVEKMLNQPGLVNGTRQVLVYVLRDLYFNKDLKLPALKDP